MGKIKSTWKLVRQSFAVLMQEKRLLFFPLVTSFLTVFIFLFFIAPIPFQPTGHSYLEPEHWEAVAESILRGELPRVEPGEAAPDTAPGWAGENLELDTWFVGYLMVLYLVSMFLLTFFNTAFFNEIINALNGRPVSIAGGLRFALTKLKPIAMWSLLAGGVGIIIQKLEHYFGLFGRWTVGLIGVVWSVASVFAVPVLIRDEESANPFEVLKKSAILFRRRWGEGLIGYVGIRTAGVVLAVSLIVVFSVLLVVLGLAVGSQAPAMMTPFLVVLIGTWLLCSILVAYFENVINKVFQCALYIYAAEGVIPGPFDQAVLDAAWKVKKQAV
jgi:hypothetical protein